MLIDVDAPIHCYTCRLYDEIANSRKVNHHYRLDARTVKETDFLIQQSRASKLTLPAGPSEFYSYWSYGLKHKHIP